MKKQTQLSVGLYVTKSRAESMRELFNPVAAFCGGRVYVPSHDFENAPNLRYVFKNETDRQRFIEMAEKEIDAQSKETKITAAAFMPSNRKGTAKETLDKFAQEFSGRYYTEAQEYSDSQVLRYVFDNENDRDRFIDNAEKQTVDKKSGVNELSRLNLTTYSKTKHPISALACLDMLYYG